MVAMSVGHHHNSQAMLQQCCNFHLSFTSITSPLELHFVASSSPLVPHYNSVSLLTFTVLIFSSKEFRTPGDQFGPGTSRFMSPLGLQNFLFYKFLNTVPMSLDSRGLNIQTQVTPQNQNIPNLQDFCFCSCHYHVPSRRSSVPLNTFKRLKMK